MTIPSQRIPPLTPHPHPPPSTRVHAAVFDFASRMDAVFFSNFGQQDLRDPGNGVVRTKFIPTLSCLALPPSARTQSCMRMDLVYTGCLHRVRVGGRLQRRWGRREREPTVHAHPWRGEARQEERRPLPTPQRDPVGVRGHGSGPAQHPHRTQGRRGGGGRPVSGTYLHLAALATGAISMFVYCVLSATESANRVSKATT